MSDRSPIPSADDLLRAHRTLRALAYATAYGEVRDLGGSPAWDGLVEGKRMVAVTTAYLGGNLDEPEARRYRAAWRIMVRE